MATTFELTQIAGHTAFVDRVYMSMVHEALYKLGQATPAEPDVLLGQRILDNSEPMRPWCFAVVDDTSIRAGAHTTDGSTITDEQIATRVTGIWAMFTL